MVTKGYQKGVYEGLSVAIAGCIRLQRHQKPKGEVESSCVAKVSHLRLRKLKRAYQQLLIGNLKDGP